MHILSVSAVLMLLAGAVFAGPEQQASPAASAPGASLAENPTLSLAAALECREILAVLQRLGCYDSALGGTGGLGGGQAEGGAAAALPRARVGAWVLQRDRDPFTDADLSSVRLAALPDVGAPAVGGGMEILLRCDGAGGRQLWIFGGRHLGEPVGGLSVRFRFGGGPVVQEVWPGALQGSAVEMPNSQSLFLEGIASRRVFAVEVETYRGKRLLGRFKAEPRGTRGLEHVLGGCSGLDELAARTP